MGGAEAGGWEAETQPDSTDAQKLPGLSMMKKAVWQSLLKDSGSLYFISQGHKNIHFHSLKPHEVVTFS